MTMTKRRGHRRTTATTSSTSSCLLLFVALTTSSSLKIFGVISASGAEVVFPIGAATATVPTTLSAPSLSTAPSSTSSSDGGGGSISSSSNFVQTSHSSLLSREKSSSSSSSSRAKKMASFLQKLLLPSTHDHHHFSPASSSSTSTTSSLLLIKSISLHCFRLLLAGYIANATYNMLKEIWDDVQSELVSARHQEQQRRRGSGGSSGRFGIGGSSSSSNNEEDVREEQDMPYFSSSSSSDVKFTSGEYLFGNQDDDGDDGEEDADGDVEKDSVIHDSPTLPFGKRIRRSESSSRRQTPRFRSSRRGGDDNDDDDYDSSHRQLTPLMAAARELAQRLHSAGFPYASEVKKTKKGNDDSGGGDGRSRRRGRTTTTTTTSVEDILQSLTRAEGNILSQTLISPLDDGMVVGSSASSVTMAELDNGEDEDDEEEEGDMVSSAASAWNAIGGLTDAKESLLDLAFPLLPTVSTQSNSGNNYYGGLLSNPPGVLLYGPPGCGKGLLVRALASTIHARFLVVSPLLRKYVGETNLNVRALFSVARKLSPTVIFVDELDGLFRERGGEDHDVGRDLKTEFLQLWDGIRNGGVGASSASSVLVIGATNRPFDVDPAFLRRMPRKIYVGLPDYDSRVSVLQGMLSRVPLDVNFDLALVASKTVGYSPSDLREVLQTAALFPLREARAEAIRNSSASPSFSVDKITGHNGEKKVGMIPIMPPLRRLRTDDVLRALEVSRPTHFSRKYRKELMNYIRNSGASSPQREMDRDDCPPPTSENYYSNNDNNFYGSNQQQHEGDSSSDEADSSDSDYDDIM